MADMGPGSSSEDGLQKKTAKDYYFDSYSHYGIHEEMLKDYVRTDTYRRAIIENSHLFKDKVVLDVGCGTGIMCMFAADAGAKAVYGVDCADIAISARKIVKENNFENTITILQGKIEEIELPVESVDIIVSEWMGYFLLYESMVDSVLFARDKWLVEGGLLFPDKARIHICGIEDSKYRKEKLDFWDDVYGYKMRTIKEMVFVEPLVDVVPPDQVMSSSQVIFEMDLYTAQISDLDFEADFEIEWKKKDFCHGLTAWFDVQYTKCHAPVGMTTAPFAEYTHWKQTVFYIDEPVRAEPGERLQGHINVCKNENNKRDLNIELSTSTSYGLQQTRTYYMR